MTLRVLIVDDQLVIRTVVRLAAEVHDGLEVCDEEAENGRQAIEFVASQAPDAVVLDYEMPEMDGLEALPAIRAALPEGVVVMYSSRESPEMITAALAAGADAYLRKGEHTPEQVAALVADMLTAGKAPRSVSSTTSTT